MARCHSYSMEAYARSEGEGAGEPAGGTANASAIVRARVVLVVAFLGNTGKVFVSPKKYFR
jgi:hypothetical protein